MAYLGREPLSGEVIVLDSIESQFNGSTRTFNLTRLLGTSNVPFYPVSTEQLLVSLGGVIQRPDRTGDTGFFINTNQITFAIAPPAGTKCFIVSFGNILDIGVPANNSVTATKIADGSVTPAKLSTGGPYWDTSGAVSIGGTWADNSNSMVYITKNTDVGNIILKGNGTGTSNAFTIYGGGWSGATDNKFTVRADGSIWGGQSDLRFGIGSTYTEALRITSSGFVGIGTSTPASLLNIKGTTPRLTIGDSQSKTWTVGDTLSSIDFSSDDTSCGGTTNKVRTRIETYVADTFGCSHGLGFYAVDIVDGVLRKHITIGSRGELTIGHSRKNQTQIITLTQNSSTFYPIELRDTYNGTSAINAILFSSTLSDNTTLYNSASIGVLSSDKGTNGSGSIVLSTKSTSDSGVVERVRITSTGNVGIGTSAPEAKLTTISTATLNGVTNCTFRSSDNATSSFYIGHGAGGVSNLVSDSPLAFGYNNGGNYVERCRITSDGKFLVGLASDPLIRTLGQSVVINTNRQANGIGNLGLYGAFISPIVHFAIGNALVSNNTQLGIIEFIGHDGTDLNSVAASISIDVDGTTGVNNMPGRIILSTTASGQETPTERLRINSSGFVGIGTTVPTATLTVGLLNANQPALNITNGFNQDTITITRNGGTGSSFKTSGPHFGPSIDISRESQNAVSNSNNTGVYVGATYQHTGSFGLGRGIDVSVANNTGSTGILYGANISATANLAGATAIGLNVNVSSTSGVKYSALFNGGNVGIGTSTPASRLEVVGDTHVRDSTITGNGAIQNVAQTTVATTSATTISSIAIATARSARYQIQITQGTEYQTADILAIHNGTTVTFMEYGNISTGSSPLGTFSMTISGGNMLLQVTMSSTTSSTVKVNRTALGV